MRKFLVILADVDHIINHYWRLLCGRKPAPSPMTPDRSPAPAQDTTPRAPQ